MALPEPATLVLASLGVSMVGVAQMRRSWLQLV